MCITVLDKLTEHLREYLKGELCWNCSYIFLKYQFTDNINNIFIMTGVVSKPVLTILHNIYFVLHSTHSVQHFSFFHHNWELFNTFQQMSKYTKLF